MVLPGRAGAGERVFREASGVLIMDGRRMRCAWTCGAVLIALLLAEPVSTGRPSPPWPPERLQDTGLYADWSSKSIAPGTLPYTPQYPLWSDGAQKSRWLRLPRGTFIDASNPDVWQFPVGTRLWKEFRFERRAETRFMERTRAGWQFATYAWNEDETDARLVPEEGIRRSVPIADGVRHAIPSRADCRACHEAGPVRVLGVTALQLSPDRDPWAPHAETPDPGSVDLASLAARRLVRGLPRALLATPPRIEAPTPTARAAIGYLHANCGSCHTDADAGELKSLALALNYRLGGAKGREPSVLLTAVGQPSRFKVPGADDVVERICAGRPDKSVLLARMGSRNPLLQMPPLGSRIVDTDAVRLIERWIAEDVGRAAGPGAATQTQ